MIENRMGIIQKFVPDLIWNRQTIQFLCALECCTTSVLLHLCSDKSNSFSVHKQKCLDHGDLSSQSVFRLFQYCISFLFFWLSEFLLVLRALNVLYTQITRLHESCWVTWCLPSAALDHFCLQLSCSQSCAMVEKEWKKHSLGPLCLETTKYCLSVPLVPLAYIFVCLFVCSLVGVAEISVSLTTWGRQFRRLSWLELK